MESIIRVANAFGAAPIYDFKKQKLTHKKVFKLYGTFLSLFIVASVITTCLYNQKVASSLSPLLASIQFLLSITSLGLFLVNVFRSSFWGMESWEKMLNLLSQVKCKRRYVSVASMILTVGGIHWVVLVTCIFYFMGMTYTALSIHVMIFQYSKLLLVCLMYIITGFITNLYQNINKIMDDISACTVIESDTLRKTRVIVRIYARADKMVALFNEIFGWPTLLILAESVEVLLVTVAIIIERSVKQPANDLVYTEVLVLNMFYTFMAIVSSSLVPHIFGSKYIDSCFQLEPSLIVFGCDAAVQEASKLFKKCYLLQQNPQVLSREREELQKIQDLIQNKEPKFTAASFFEIKRSTLLSLISTTTTYMIVILQFSYL